jgi:quinol monooxygenase YgiN
MSEAMGLVAVFKSAPGRLDQLIDDLTEVADAAKHEPGTLRTVFTLSTANWTKCWFTRYIEMTRPGDCTVVPTPSLD